MRRHQGSGRMAMTGSAKRMSLAERELLIPELVPNFTGFKPRPVEKLASRHPPVTSLSIECKHFLRNDAANFTHEHPATEYRLWLEAGKYDPPCPERPDVSYNSNVWRNFTEHVGFTTSAEGRKVSDVIATMYPINIPPPSRIGSSTFEKYITENKLFSRPRTRALAIERIRQAMKESERQRLRSEARFPPMDTDGRILPPENFKYYAHRFVPVPEAPPTPPPANQKTDLFGQRYVPRSQPLLHKLTQRMNHPDYQRLQEEMSKRRELATQERQSYSSRPLPTPINPPVNSARPLLHSQ